MNVVINFGAYVQFIVICVPLYICAWWISMHLLSYLWIVSKWTRSLDDQSTLIGAWMIVGFQFLVLLWMSSCDGISNVFIGCEIGCLWN